MQTGASDDAGDVGDDAVADTAGEGTETVSDVPGTPATGVLAGVLAASYVLLLRVLDPRLLLRDTLATGGDMGSHHYISKAAEAFFPWTWGGWAPGWYAGHPMLDLYFPLPYLGIWFGSKVIGYPVAFKLVAVAGTLTLPLACWALFKLLDAPVLARALAPAAAVTFLFVEGRKPGAAVPGVLASATSADTTQLDIFGGFLTSTMAGEFAYSLGLSTAVVTLGLLYRTTRRWSAGGPPPWGWLALTSAAAGLSLVTHLIPMALIGIGTPAVVIGAIRPGRPRTAGIVTGAAVTVVGLVVARAVLGEDAPWTHGLAWTVVAVAVGVWAGLLVAGFDWRRLAAVAVVGVVGFAVCAFWFLPFFVGHKFTAPAKWTNSYGSHWFASRWWWPVLAVAAVGVAVAVWRRRPGMLVLAWCAIGAVVAFELVPSSQMVNGRVLPLWYLMTACLAMWTLGELADAVPGHSPSLRWSRTAVAVAVAALLVASTAATATKNSPAAESTWASYNFSGFEAKEGWAELQELMQALQALPPGRVAWEYSDDFGRFGTPRALENIPFFTDKPTMEGLLVESSPSSLPHFWMQGMFSARPTGAVPLDDVYYPLHGDGRPTEQMIDDAVTFLRLFGVRWFVAWTDESPSNIKTNMAARDDVRFVQQLTQFTIYEIEDSAQVYVPQHPPVYFDPDGADWRDLQLDWLRSGDPRLTAGSTGTNRWPFDVPVTFGALGTSDPGAAGTPLAALPQITSFEELAEPSIADTVQSGAGPVRSRSDRDGTRISFRTDRIGEPHIVAESYNPRWRARGADGPYLVTPSLMLVFPTADEVVLEYGTNGWDRLGRWITLVGWLVVVLMAVAWWRARRRRAQSTILRARDAGAGTS